MANTKVTSAVIADNAITSAKIDSTSTGMTFADLTVTGEIVTSDGLTIESSSGATLNINTNAGATDAKILLHEGTTASPANGASIRYDGANNIFKIGVGSSVDTTRLSIDRATGDISFYEDTGTTAKLFWDASAESLGIGKTPNRSRLLEVAGTMNLDDGSEYEWGDGSISIGGNSSTDVMTFATASAERMRINSSGSIISQRSVAGSATNLYLINTRDVDGDDVGINFGFVSNGTYAKGGIFFQRKTTAGRGTLYFCNDVVSDSGNASIADSKMHINQGGYTKHSNDGTYQAAEGNYHEYRQTANEQALRITATNASYSDSMLRVDTSRAASTSSGFIRSEANGALQFLVRGDGTIFAQNTTVQQISDIRTKQNITDATDGLDVINSLRPVRFDFKEGFGNEKTNQLGFIAQEVETVFPDAVDVWGESDEEGNPYKSLGTTTLIPVLVKAIQEQQTIIDDLKARIETLENA